jgi:hypothetical protein
MNIETIRDNLVNTIAGKEALLEDYKKASARAVMLDTADRITIAAMAGFLSTNIDELKTILEDVEQLVEKDVEQSWRNNPERMGGQFTQDEIDNANKW